MTLSVVPSRDEARILKQFQDQQQASVSLRLLDSTLKASTDDPQAIVDSLVQKIPNPTLKKDFVRYGQSTQQLDPKYVHTAPNTPLTS